MDSSNEFEPGGVYSLEMLCLNVLRKKPDLDYIGYYPYHMLKPILVNLDPRKLFKLENNNKRLLAHTDELWERHLKQNFQYAWPEALEKFKSFRRAYCNLKFQERKNEEEMINKLKQVREKQISKPTQILKKIPRIPLDNRGFIPKPKSLFDKAMSGYKRDRSVFHNRRK